MRRMKHPQHGWTHAYTPTEEAYLRRLGWGDDDPEPPPKNAEEPVSVPPPIEVVEQPSPPEPPQPAGGGTPIKRKPGRPRKK